MQRFNLNFDIKTKILRDFLIAITFAGPPYVIYAYHVNAAGIFNSTFYSYILAVSAWVLFVKNRIVTAALVLSFAVWVAVTLTIIYSGGLSSPAFVWVPVPLILISIVLRRVYGYVFAAISIAFAITLFILETHYTYSLPNEVDKLGNYQYFQILCILFPVVLVMYFSFVIISHYDKAQDLIKKQHYEIRSSIQYAKTIVESTLPDPEELKERFRDFFLIFLPKDIVSGDFYWYSRKGRYVYVAVVDCTGHGVPGAFMSVIGKCLFKSISSKQGTPLPSQVLDSLNRLLSVELYNSRSNDNISDGMDLALCRINLETYELDFAGAMRPLLLVHDGNLSLIKGDRMPIGHYNMHYPIQKFTNHTFQLKENDMIYMFSDGYQDQFGGENEKKYSRKRILATIKQMYNSSGVEQRKTLVENLLNWKGTNEQIDDILFLGIRI